MRVGPAFLALITTTTVLAGCLGAEEIPVPDEPDAVPNVTQWVHDGRGLALDRIGAFAGPVPTHFLSYVGLDGAEPSIGVTSDGSIFFVAMENVLRSQDNGSSWQVVSDLLSSPATLDPFLHVDPVTDRIYSDQLYLGCSYLSWSDDLGDSWTSNPIACGAPINDHQKVYTGPFVPENEPLNLSSGYGRVVYYAYNALAGGRVAVSFDGGLTFPVTSQTFVTDCGIGGLHGRLKTAPDGTAYVPGRNCDERGPIVSRSTDNGITWSWTTIHDQVGTAAYQKNPDIAIDTDNGVYVLWPGKDNLLYLSASPDGEAWATPVRAAPNDIGTATFPSAVAGSPGRLAFAYYATKNDTTDAPDLVPETTHWHAFVTYTLNAQDPAPVFVTIQLTPDDDPIQVGPISTNSDDAPPGSRNLLDFIDMVIDHEGRPYVAFADGCTAKCELDNMSTSRDREGVAAIMTTGPSLFAARDVVTEMTIAGPKTGR